MTQYSTAQRGREQCSFSLEYLHLQDYTATHVVNFDDIGIKLTGLLDTVRTRYPGSRYGIATFVDKPIQPFGYSANEWYDGDWCYNVTSVLSDSVDPSAMISNMLSASPGGGADWPENQLGALHDIAVNDSLSGWSTDVLSDEGKPIVRVMSMSTDSIYHMAPQGALSEHALRPNDGDGHTVCDKEDYPSILQLQEALHSRDIYLMIFAARTTLEDVAGVYDELLSTMGIRGRAYRLWRDSSDLLIEANRALRHLEEVICATPTVDIVLAADVTHSYQNDMPNLRPKIQAMYETFTSYVAPRIGLTTFGDKPIAPFGFSGSGDYCYALQHGLTTDPQLVMNAADSVYIQSGVDWKESQLDGIISTLADPNMGWRTGDEWQGFELFRILVIATDSGYHQHPDAHDAGYDLRPRSTYTTVTDCLGDEYATWQQVAEALIYYDVTPLFVVTSDIVVIYRDLLAKLETYGVIGLVVELANFMEPVSGNVAREVQAVTERLLQERRRRMMEIFM